MTNYRQSLSSFS